MKVGRDKTPMVLTIHVLKETKEAAIDHEMNEVGNRGFEFKEENKN